MMVNLAVISIDISWFQDLLAEHRGDLLMALFALVGTIVRAMGITVQSGQRALRFTGGRAGDVLEPGFHWLIPFLQIARPMPTRSRTMDLPAQRVTTLEGFVFTVDANLVYRVSDLRKALVEIDDLEKGMEQMLGLGVQEVLRQATQEAARGGPALDQALTNDLQHRLTPWGVSVEQAGFTTITPSRETMRLTQLGHATAERGAVLALIVKEGTRLRMGMNLLGSRMRARSRTRVLRTLEERGRRSRRRRRLLMGRGVHAYRALTIGRVLRVGLASNARLPARAPRGLGRKAPH